MEEELEAERQARSKAERQRSDLAREMESLGERLNEATGTTHAQIELNKKRESEVTKLRKDLEECRIQHDATCVSMKKKQQDAVAEMSEQIDQLGKMKAKYVDYYLNKKISIVCLIGLRRTRLRLWLRSRMFVLLLMRWVDPRPLLRSLSGT